MTFSFGLQVPPQAEALILYTRASWTVPTHLPRARLAFVAGEPEDIHPYAAGFLNQFGQVVAPGTKPLETRRRAESPCLPWFVGFDFAHPEGAWSFETLRDLRPGLRDDRISIVTSRKATTPYHSQRLAFIEHLKAVMPDEIVLYGREFRPVADKADALLPHRYHLALENGAGRYSWTEKLADPLICGALPFYVGCENVVDELPADAVLPLDLSDFDAAVASMRAAVAANAADARAQAIETARDRVLNHHNIMALFARITQNALAEPAQGPAVTIRSERSLPPEVGARGSWPEMVLRRALLAVDPGVELRFARWKAARRS
ncbi:MAG: hypothetical protein AAF631_08490 [Pseudomonadota bacterium]